MITLIANLATIFAVVLAVLLFRQDIQDRLLGRPLVAYKLHYLGSTYQDGLTAKWVHAANSGHYSLFVTNQGREPAFNLKISIQAFAELRQAYETVSEASPLRDPFSKLLRKADGPDRDHLYYEIDRLRPGGYFIVGFARKKECSVNTTPEVNIQYENEKGAQLKAVEEPSEKRPDFASLRARGEVDCDLPPLDLIETADHWTPDMIYYVRLRVRQCGIQATMPEIIRLTGALKKEFQRPRDFGRVGGMCERFRQLLSQ